MNKPLTIEQLKSLEVGDWVWVNDAVEQIYSYMQNRQETIYNGKREAEICLETPSHYKRYSYSDYGKTWLAYKNKEEAVGEYDSLAVENEVAKQDIENLKRTIEEMNEALRSNGIIIDCDGNVIDERAEAAANEYVTVLNNNTILAEKLGEVEQENIRLWKLIKDHDKSVEEAKKQVAKEILQKTRELHDSPEYDARDGYDCNALVAYDKVMYFIKRKYNVEVANERV